ncbi:hypothetical protein EDF56_10727 [Novosphingobium sp. PhB165]|uniref:hypothetical protein n=1 Tax=Novosphingobium sp. PhB165 TaxID=2485105 RepID=UPI001051A729|nr:hypothetical protein [Novosphingobium sp. PhB165]TCM16448.1 hypothetical protein EDF56_10727 [Novosphingobium sp. PhB165]
MIGKIISAVVGSKIAQDTPGLSGPGGAALGVVAISVFRRLGPLGMAAAAGGWLASRELDKRARRKAAVPGN